MLLSPISDLLKLSVIYSNGFNRHNATVIANGHSELALHACSTGPTSPKLKAPPLLINVKLVASPESKGLNKFPSPSTGMCDIRLDLLYLSRVPAREP